MDPLDLLALEHNKQLRLLLAAVGGNSSGPIANETHLTLGNEGSSSANLWLAVADNAVQMSERCPDSSSFETADANLTADRCSVNATGEDDFNTFYFYQTEQMAFLCILFILIVVGNMAVLLALSMSSARKSRMNYFIKHLAIADLSVGVISVLTDIVWKITVAWHAGNVACKVIRFSQVLVTYSSTYVLVALSIDRYDAICHPMNFSRGWRRARILVAVAWILSAIFSTPMLVLYEEGLVQDQVQCWIDLPSPWQWQLYLTLVAVSLLVLPACLIFACYIIIVRTIWVQSAALTASVPTNHRNNNNVHRTGVADDDQESRRASSRGIIPRAKIKTVKMTFVIVFVFILCWAPYIVFDLLQVYGHIPKTKTMIAVATFIQSLAPLNSAANPLIYCLFSTHLCRNLRKIPALEWLARRLEDAVHSMGLCPGWSCCGADAATVSPDSLPKANGRQGANRLHPACNRHRQVSSQFRAPFRRGLGPQSSTTTLTTVNMTSSTMSHTGRYDGAAETLLISGTKAALVGKLSSSANEDSVICDEPVTTIDEHSAFRSRSEWV